MAANQNISLILLERIGKSNGTFWVKGEIVALDYLSISF